jgi:hypothetical protein
MVRRYGCLLLVSLLAMSLLIVPISQAATSPKSEGLLITPVREYSSVAAGTTQSNILTVANITNKPIVVTLSVEQFSVADYTYDYTFMPAKEDWVKMQVTQFTLQPDKSQVVPYAIMVPANAAPGGHYFTIFATASLHTGAISSDVRVATVLYVTVAGKLIKTSRIKKETIPWISFGSDIPFTLDVQDTGNTHFFIYTSGKLIGWTARPAIEEPAHILLPGTIRTVESRIVTPLLPGVYKAEYGYKTDGGQTVNRSSNVIYLPPWSLAIPLGLGWILFILLQRRKQSMRK